VEDVVSRSPVGRGSARTKGHSATNGFRECGVARSFFPLEWARPRDRHGWGPRYGRVAGPRLAGAHRDSPQLVDTARAAVAAKTRSFFSASPGRRGAPRAQQGSSSLDVGREDASQPRADPLPRRAHRYARLRTSPTLAAPQAAAAAGCLPTPRRPPRAPSDIVAAFSQGEEAVPRPPHPPTPGPSDGGVHLGRRQANAPDAGNWWATSAGDTAHTRVRGPFLFFFLFCRAGRLYLGDGPRGHGAAQKTARLTRPAPI